MNRLDIESRVVVVTGGARGIGYATAKRALASGAAGALWDVERDGSTDRSRRSRARPRERHTVELTERPRAARPRDDHRVART